MFEFKWKTRTGCCNATGFAKMPLIELWCGEQCLAQITPTTITAGGKDAVKRYDVVWWLFSPNRPTAKTLKKFNNLKTCTTSYVLTAFKRDIEEYCRYELEKLKHATQTKYEEKGTACPKRKKK